MAPNNRNDKNLYCLYIKNLATHQNKNIFFHRIWRWFLCLVTCKLLHSITSSAVSILINQSGLCQAPIALVLKQILWCICHRYVKTMSNTSVNWHDTAMRWVLHFDTIYFRKHMTSAGGWLHLYVWAPASHSSFILKTCTTAYLMGLSLTYLHIHCTLRR